MKLYSKMQYYFNQKALDLSVGWNYSENSQAGNVRDFHTEI